MAEHDSGGRDVRPRQSHGWFVGLPMRICPVSYHIVCELDGGNGEAKA